MKILTVLLLILLYFNPLGAEELPELNLELPVEKNEEKENLFNVLTDDWLDFDQTYEVSRGNIDEYLDNYYFCAKIVVFNVFSWEERGLRILTYKSELKSPTTPKARLGFKLRFSVMHISN